MIEIKPKLQHQSNCPHCGTVLKPVDILWQGMHVCVESICVSCKAEIIEDLPVGHGSDSPYQIDLLKGKIFGNKNVFADEWFVWFGQPFLESLQNPEPEEVEISKEVFKDCSRVIILNCIDNLYGHCLLKLLNAQRHLERYPEQGLVVLIPKFLRWMVPEGVAEVWTVNLSLRASGRYYPSIDQFIRKECNRFDEICLSEAYSHPSKFDITKFTKVPKHSFEQEEFKITFIWREDRIWYDFIPFKVLRKSKIITPALLMQNWNVQRLFNKIRSRVPTARFAIAGLGKKTKFPEWIEDFRVDKFDEKIEVKMCQVYSESRLIIGLHGSNMLLPSGHAGMTLEVMPDWGKGKMYKDRWGNMAQDILYQETDPRLASYRYRYLPFQTNIAELAHIASEMILRYSYFKTIMTADNAL
jgi:hypothetical protein